MIKIKNFAYFYRIKVKKKKKKINKFVKLEKVLTEKYKSLKVRNSFIDKYEF